MEFLQVFPMHHCKQYISECCDLINSEWPRSKAARYQSLFMSCDKFPTSLVLILNEEQVVGHCKLSEIRFGGDEVMIESVVIHREHRGKGWGKILMEDAEEYLRNKGKKVVYLSTRGQEGFYKKLGYEVCKPVMFFGFCDITPDQADEINPAKPKAVVPPNTKAPVPPPMPAPQKKYRSRKVAAKTFMKKNI